MTPEKIVENKMRKNFENAGGYIIKKFADPHSNKGIPDLIGTLNGIFIALEVKRPTGGKPTPVQLHNLQAIANAGGLAFVSNDPDISIALAEYTKTHRSIKHRPIKLNNLIIDHATVPEDIQVEDATHLWTQTKGNHSLQIVPNN